MRTDRNLIDISQNITNNKGNNVQTIPSEVTKLCNQYIKSEYGYNYTKIVDTLNIPKKIF
jgi:hypothetical protein